MKNIKNPFKISFPEKQSQDDLFSLFKSICADKRFSNVKISLEPHKIYQLESDVIKSLGYLPSGKWHLYFQKKKKIISCIRGFVSMGRYELVDITNNKVSNVAVRFATIKEVKNEIINRLNLK